MRTCFGENAKGVAETLLDKEISMGTNHKFNRLPQKKPGGDGIIQQRGCQDQEERNER